MKFSATTLILINNILATRCNNEELSFTASDNTDFCLQPLVKNSLEGIKRVNFDGKDSFFIAEKLKYCSRCKNPLTITIKNPIETTVNASFPINKIENVEIVGLDLENPSKLDKNLLVSIFNSLKRYEGISLKIKEEYKPNYIEKINLIIDNTVIKDIDLKYNNISIKDICGILFVLKYKLTITNLKLEFETDEKFEDKIRSIIAPIYYLLIYNGATDPLILDITINVKNNDEYLRFEKSKEEGFIITFQLEKKIAFLKYITIIELLCLMGENGLKEIKFLKPEIISDFCDNEVYKQWYAKTYIKCRESNINLHHFDWVDEISKSLLNREIDIATDDLLEGDNNINDLEFESGEEVIVVDSLSEEDDEGIIIDKENNNIRNSDNRSSFIPLENNIQGVILNERHNNILIDSDEDSDEGFKDDESPFILLEDNNEELILNERPNNIRDSNEENDNSYDLNEELN